MALTGKTIGQLTYLSGVTNDTLLPVEFNGDTYHIDYSSITNYQEVTYDELYSLYTGSTLIPGRYYLISDFQTCYDQPNYDSEGNAITVGNYKTGTTEPLMVFATSTETLSPQAYSTQYPLDKISYTINFNVTEVTSSPAKGRITERIDERNNRADYDFRAVQFIRYSGFFSEQVFNGRINFDGAGLVTGVDTLFNSDFIVGDILGIYYEYGGAPIGSFRYYEITSITNDTEMNVSGTSMVGAANTIYSRGIELPQYMNPFQCNVTSINYTGFSEYYTFNDVENFNTYLGNNVDYYVFLLSNNVFLNGFYENNYFSADVVGNTFNDDMDSNQCGPYFQYNIITNDFDDNLVGPHFTRNIIDCDMDGNLIGESFRDNMIGDGDGVDFDYNKIGANFYSNFITMNNDNFLNNNIGDTFYNNLIDSGFENNTIVGNFNNNVIKENSFNSNVIQQDCYNNVITQDFNLNNIGGSFGYNYFSGGSFVNNNIGTNFSVNNIYDSSFTNNKIGEGFNENSVYTSFVNNTVVGDFNSNALYYPLANNQIGVSFESNLIGDIGTINSFYFQNNIIGYQFKSNQLSGCNFDGNTIKDIFLANTISANINYNTIGSNFFLNTVNGQMIQNHIGQYFEVNDILGTFYYNTIGSNFHNNTVGDGFGFNGGSYRGNVIGNNFHNNNIGEYFYTNRITDNFGNNTVGDNFQNNDITYNELNGIDFTTYYNGIENTSSSGGNGGSDGTWVGVTQSSTTGVGIGASFDITTFGGLVTLIVVNTPGKLYGVGDELTIDGASIGGAANLIITVDTVTDTPLVYTNANCTISNSRDYFAVISTIDWDTVSWYISNIINGPYIP